MNNKVNRCSRCEHYDEENHICKNSKAFRFNDNANVRDFDDTGVSIVADMNQVMIPYNFGCIFFLQQEPNYRYDYEDDEDFENEEDDYENEELDDTFDEGFDEDFDEDDI